MDKARFWAQGEQTCRIGNLNRAQSDHIPCDIGDIILNDQVKSRASQRGIVAT